MSAATSALIPGIPGIGAPKPNSPTLPKSKSRAIITKSRSLNTQSQRALGTQSRNLSAMLTARLDSHPPKQRRHRMVDVNATVESAPILNRQKGEPMIALWALFAACLGPLLLILTVVWVHRTIKDAQANALGSVPAQFETP